MRECSRCHAADRIHLTSERCSCGADADSLLQSGHIAGDADHAPECFRIAHFVIRDWPFPKVYLPRDLVKADADERKAAHGWLLPIAFRAAWRLVARSRESPPRSFARVRTLCRDCIVLEIDGAEQTKEYEKLKKSAVKDSRGGKLGWAEGVTSQDWI